MNDTTLTAAATSASPPTISRLWVILALLSVYLVWGSTYLAIRVALESYPPFLMASVRFFCAGLLMYVVLRLRGMTAPTKRQWRNCAFVGTLLLAGGNGLVCYAEQTVASGLAAVAVASMPLFAALFAGLAGVWPRRLEWIGLIIGFAGVVLLNLGGELKGSPIGAVALILAAAIWAYGSVWSRRQDMPNPIMGTAAQMLCASVVLGVMAYLHSEAIPIAPSATSTWALIYLAIAGSIIGFSAYLYLLHHVRPALATSYAYVNPPVAVLFGVLLGGEYVHTLDIVGMVVILLGVAGITLAREKR